MDLTVLNQSLAAAGRSAAAETGYQISRSLRFNSADSAYLSRTNGTSTDEKKFTLSFWMKRNTISTATGQWIFSGGNSSGTDTLIGFNTSSDALQFANSAVSADGQTTLMLFRDVSSWYHVVIVGDSTQGSNADRIKFYVNGVQQATSTTGTIALNSTFNWNRSSVAVNIGRYTVGGSNYANLQFTEIHNVDGQALTPSDFGETDTTTGVWKPKAYAGTYGTNGFYLNFSDGSSVSALGTDFSGNGNDWTPTNFAVGTQVYSSQITGTVEESSAANTGPAYNQLLFNGSSSAPYVRAYQASTVTWTPSTAYTSVTDIALFTWYPSGNTALGTLFYVNGSLVTPTAKTQGGWTTLPIPAGGTVTSVGFGNNNAGDYVYVAQIRINSTVITQVTSGADNLVDTPTPYGTDTGAGGEVRGNYATLNPLQYAGTNGNLPSNGNLTVNSNGSANPTKTFPSTIAASSGKFYAEFLISATQYAMFSVSDVSLWTTTFASGLIYGNGTVSWDISQQYYYINSTSSTATGIAGAANDIIMIAFDADTRKVWFGRNGTWNASGDPAAGTNEIGTVAGTNPLAFVVRSENMTVDCNFGQRPFAYTAPSGFKALCTQNLPTPTIKQGNDYHNAVLYTGSASVGNQNVTGFGFNPDFVWIKARSGVARGHVLFDQVRGDNAALYSHATAAEATWIDQGFITDGYTVSATYSSETNANGESFVMWGWKAGGSNATNTDGTITSTVRANPTAGFSIVTATKSAGSSTAQTFGHGLTIAPKMLILKRRNGAEDWYVYHASLGNTARIQLNSTSAQTTGSQVWGSTTPTSTVFTIQSFNDGDFVTYCFAEIEGFSKFGSYTANASTNGPFIYTGFRPSWVMFKRTDSTGTWFILDSTRDTYNVASKFLEAQDSDAEASTQPRADFVANGIKIRAPSGYTPNDTSSSIYIYMAFAENPFKYSLAR